MTEPATPQRRTSLRLDSEDAVIAEINRLRRGYVRTGGWTLPQVCHHLERSVAARMSPGPHPDTTPEQAARREVLRQALASGRLPDGITAPEPMMPPPDCGDAAIDACIERLQQYKAFPGPTAPHRLFGRLDEPDARRLNLIHCAHHLGFLVPTEPTPAVQRRPHLAFATVDDAIAEIERLGRGYRRAGEWSLEQICWHCRTPLRHGLDHPTDAEPTPDEVRFQQQLTAIVAAAGRSGGTGKRVESQPALVPPTQCDVAEPARMIDALRKLAAWDRPRLALGPAGPTPVELARKFHLFHLGHHLSFLVPTTQA